MKKNYVLALVTALFAMSSHAAPEAHSETMTKEISTKSESGPLSFFEIADVYKKRVDEFRRITKSGMTVAQRTAILNHHLDYAANEIDNQTGGWGITHYYLMSVVDELRADVASARFKTAADKVDATAGKILSLF